MILALSAAFAATVGQPAPLFELQDLAGKTVKLADLKGKTVVIEWYNPDCPFIQYAHGAGGPLAAQPKRLADAGVVFLSINSSAPGKQGNGAALNQERAKSYGLTHPVLLDESGKVGKEWGATNTPHMYVVDKNGVLAYAGALDNAPLGKVDGAVVNYVDAAVADLAAGRPVATPTTKAYGCSVKY